MSLPSRDRTAEHRRYGASSKPPLSSKARAKKKGRRADMERLKVWYDEKGQTLTVWFDDPSLEHVAEETGDEIVLMKDRTGRVIGFEKLNFAPADPRNVAFDFETVGV